MERKNRKNRIGTVLSNKMDKTAVVAVESHYKHPLYNKILKKVKKYKVHDPEKSCEPGDVVRISETRPLSKTKTWRLAEIIRKGQ
ncbi:MAG: 30S ribosomal protein S17 [Actinobacteria bacterium]|nr:30S ribosomal protein S17 [Actinomycetota bacterium]